MAIADKPADLAAAAIAGVSISASPVIGDYVVILLCAVAGAFVAVSRRDDLSHNPIRSVVAMLRGVLIAAVFSWIATVWLSARIELPLVYLLGPVSFAIAFIGDDWFAVKAVALEWLTRKGKE